MQINAAQLPCDEATFLAKFAEYRAARDAHRLTVGVPAPFPEYEIFRVLYERGEAPEIVRDELQEEAAKANRNALAELDALKAKVAELEGLKAQVDAIALAQATVASA